MKNQHSLILIFLVLVTSIVKADITLQYQIQSTTAVFNISQGKLRVEDGKTNRALLYDLKDDQLVALDFKQKKYVDMDIMMDKINAMKNAFTLMMEKQMQGMSPEQKQAMQKIMAGMGNTKKETTKQKTTQRQTGEIEKINGFNCQKIILTQGEIQDAFCVAPLIAVGMAKEDYQVMNAFIKHMKKLADKMGGMGKQEAFLMPEDINGIPIKRYGKKQSTLTKVDHKALNGDLFRVPKGYTLKRTPTLNR